MSRPDDSDDAAAGQHGEPTENGVETRPSEQKQQERAAQMIQRNYRGYRERRQLEGIGLDANARWSEVCTVPDLLGFFPAIPLTSIGSQRGSAFFPIAL